MRSTKLGLFATVLTTLIFTALTPIKGQEQQLGVQSGVLDCSKIDCAASLLKVEKPTGKLSEEQKLKVENFKLKTQVAQLQATLADREQKLKIYEIALSQNLSTELQKVSANLTVEQTKLVEELRRTLKADADETFNWDTLKFEKPKKDDEKK